MIDKKYKNIPRFTLNWFGLKGNNDGEWVLYKDIENLIKFKSRVDNLCQFWEDTYKIQPKESDTVKMLNQSALSLRSIIEEHSEIKTI